MRAVDAHFHVWRQADLPWLAGPMQPRIFGPYEAIRRDYPMEEYLADRAGTGVERAVYVQANWPVDRAEAEADWLEALVSRTGWPHGIVAYADMGVEDERVRLEWVSASEGQRFADIVNDMTERIKFLGPSRIPGVLQADRIER